MCYFNTNPTRPYVLKSNDPIKSYYKKLVLYRFLESQYLGNKLGLSCAKRRASLNSFDLD